MARERYILLRDTVEYKKGAIFEEKCDDGTQDFVCVNAADFANHDRLITNSNWEYYRELIVNNPAWFAKITLVYLTAEQLRRVKKNFRHLILG